MEAISYRPAIYAQFSSARQDERSIDDQIRRCRDHLGPAAEQVEVFADYAVSGASLHRRGFTSHSRYSSRFVCRFRSLRGSEPPLVRLPQPIRPVCAVS